jgi:hydrogenase maturation protease
LEKGGPVDALYGKAPWHILLKRLLQPPCELFAVGNPIRGDDSVGLYVIEHLQHKYGKRPGKRIAIHDPITAPEITPPAPFFKESTIIIIDSAELNMEPGKIALVSVSNTRYGFFSTHNIPLRLIPHLSSEMSRIWILGIQPEDISIKEELSGVVKHSADNIIKVVGTLLRGEKR